MQAEIAEDFEADAEAEEADAETVETAETEGTEITVPLDAPDSSDSTVPDAPKLIRSKEDEGLLSQLSSTLDRARKLDAAFSVILSEGRSIDAIFDRAMAAARTLDAACDSSSNDRCCLFRDPFGDPFGGSQARCYLCQGYGSSSNAAACDKPVA